MLKQTVLIILILFLPALFASKVIACEDECVEKDSWAVGIAVGAGKFNNPVHDGKERNVSLLPSVYYYGERFYVENTVMGYTFYESDLVSIDFKGAFNKDGLYFNDSFIDSLIIADFMSPGNFGEPEVVSANDVDRELSYMGGVGVDFFLTDSLQVSIGAANDISGVHNGHQFGLTLSHRYQTGDFILRTGIGAEYRNGELNNYYYGLTSTEIPAILDGIQIESGINRSFSFSVSYKIDEHYSLIALYKYDKLPTSITISPLIDKSSSDFYFMGFSYQFGSD